MSKEEWLEIIAKRVITADDGEIRTMFFALTTSDDAVETIYSSDSMADKLLIAGIIQQDAMLQTLAANADNDDEDGE